jgi:hypothetical protein
MAAKSTATFTATRSQHGKVTRITVRDAKGEVTDTTNSTTMRYAEVSVTAKGKVLARSQKPGGTPERLGATRVLVTDEAKAEKPAKAKAPAKAPAKAKAEKPAKAKKPLPPMDEEARKAHRKAMRAARLARMTPEQAAARKARRKAASEARRARKAAAKKEA